MTLLRKVPVFLIVIALLWLSGCGSTGNNVRSSKAYGPNGEELDVNAIPKEGRIAVISLMGSNLEFVNLGTTIFHTQEEGMNTSSWKLDAHVSENMVQQLSLHTSLTPEIYDPWTGKSLRPVIQAYNAWTGSVLPEFNALVKKAAAAKSSEFVLLAVAAKWIGLEEPIFGTTQSLQGYGIFQRSLLGRRNAVDYLLMDMFLCDGATGAVIARTMVLGHTDRGPELWVEFGDKPDAGNLEQTRRALISMFDHNVGVLLKNLRLQ